MRRLRALAIGVAVIVLLLVVAQIVLPGIAAQDLRDRLSRGGKVLSVSVSAFPAIELLWHQADKVVVRLERYRSTTGHLQSLLNESSDTGSLDASVHELDTGLITLHDAALRKRGSTLTGSATVTPADLRAALGGAIQNLQPVASGNGELTFQGTVFGVTADATLRAQDGALVVSPDVPLLNLITVNVFRDPHLYIEGVGASDAPNGFAVRGRAQLR
jgi:LmeA-like phospholipid-binding